MNTTFNELNTLEFPCGGKRVCALPRNLRCFPFRGSLPGILNSTVICLPRAWERPFDAWRCKSQSGRLIHARYFRGLRK